MQETNVAFYDLPLAELETYSPALPVPSDLDEFWSTTLAEARTVPLDVTFDEVETPLKLVTTYDVTFPGFGGDPIKAWLQVPKGATGPLPTIVEYVGYSGGRGFPHRGTLWVTAGYSTLIMDTRGEGWGFSTGSTPDPHTPMRSNGGPGHMTRGILDPKDYFYRRVYTDAVRAIEAAALSPFVDASRIVVTGGSQGGGLALAAAALSDGVAGAMMDVPFLSHFERAITLTNRDPYNEIARYLTRNRDHYDQAMRTLSYFDGAVLASRATAPGLFAVALMDDICPPSTVFAAYNRYGGQKRIEVYPFNNHEAGEEFHEVKKYKWLTELFG